MPDTKRFRHWRDIAEEVSVETDPAKLSALIQELCNSFDAHDRERDEQLARLRRDAPSK